MLNEAMSSSSTWLTFSLVVHHKGATGWNFYSMFGFPLHSFKKGSASVQST
jgi:hypothetical protein